MQILNTKYYYQNKHLQKIVEINFSNQKRTKITRVDSSEESLKSWGVFRYRLFLLKIENNNLKKKLLFICLNALFMSHE